MNDIIRLRKYYNLVDKILSFDNFSHFKKFDSGKFNFCTISESACVLYHNTRVFFSITRVGSINYLSYMHWSDDSPHTYKHNMKFRLTRRKIEEELNNFLEDDIQMTLANGREWLEEPRHDNFEYSLFDISIEFLQEYTEYLGVDYEL